MSLDDLMQRREKIRKQNRALYLIIMASLVGVFTHFGLYEVAAFLAVLYLGALELGY
jgi:hypothetical protein